MADGGEQRSFAVVFFSHEHDVFHLTLTLTLTCYLSAGFINDRFLQ